MLHISQGDLELLETCPRKFQHLYLEGLSSPSNPEHQERLLLGSRFHLLMQQRELELPVESLVQSEQALQDWYGAFTNAAPAILQLPDGESGMRQSEFPRSMELIVEGQSYLLTVVYDLLIRGDRHARILDWKTYPKPRQSRWLEHHWQTRLYLFVLAETEDYPPENLGMTYWFFQAKGDRSDVPEPQSLAIPYSTAHHEQTRRNLTHLLSQLNHWLETYHQGIPFPQTPEATGHCQRCAFTLRCQRQPETQAPSILGLPDFATIEEVPI